uniref:Transmembrane protein n=1 Tax=Panagrolaimus sp. ES5 TaxID=591445 RepID=A0AC34GV72_9BILA
MSKALFLFLIFTFFQLCSSLSETCPKYLSIYSIFPKCDVKKDFQKIYNGKLCSNLVEIIDAKSYFWKEKGYLEVINEHTIKQWTLTNTSQKSAVIEIRDYKICYIGFCVVINSKVDFTFETPFGFYYTSWNYYSPNKSPSSYLFLTAENSLILLTSQYVVVVKIYGQKVVQADFFSKSENAFIESVELKSFKKNILSLTNSIFDKKKLVATFEDGTKEYFSIKYPTEAYEPVSVSGKNYSTYSSYDGRHFIVLPIGLIFYALKKLCCSKQSNLIQPEDNDKLPNV